VNRLIYLPFLLAAAAPVFAGTSPIPPSLLGNSYVSFAPPDNNPFPWQNLIGPFPAGYGGAFQADIYSSPNGPVGTPGLTTVWCVDYQLDVEPNDQYSANITSLASITTPTDNSVRYGNQTTDWANPVTDPSNPSVNTNSAAYRYALTAALISEYEDVNSSISSPLTVNTADPINNPDPTNPVDNSVNQAIQTAIWYMTYNSEYEAASWAPFNPAAYNVQQGSAASNPSNYLYWVNWAEHNVDSVNLNDWAVISGSVKDGVLQVPNGNYQTFLVQVDGPTTITTFGEPTPEPAFYGVLGVGLAGLFAARMRKKSAPAT
jgi:hypothetical protein